MLRKMRNLFFTVLLFLPILTAGCSPDMNSEAVVARVNGHPIYLEEVEAWHDANYFRWFRGLPPDLQAIKSSYGKVLMNLVVQNLIEQELQSRGLKADAAKLKKIEQEIRQDYPQGGFDEVILEENIDLGLWRAQVMQNLAWEKFSKEILRPEISIEVQDIKRYYQDYIEDFFIPERIVFLHFSSREESKLQAALDTFIENEDTSSLGRDYPQVNIISYEMRVDRLPLGLHKELTTLEPGEKSEISKDLQDHYHSVFIVDRIESTLLKPHQVYSLIEENLVKERMLEVFNSWLERAVAEAKIEINPKLLETSSYGQR